MTSTFPANAGTGTAIPGAALIVTALEGIEATAAALATRLNLTIEIASTRSAACRLLDRRSWAIVVLDQLFADADPEGADLLWKRTGLAIPLQINFGLAGADRLEREIQAALARRLREQELAAAVARAHLDSELRNAITGFLLESRLALSEPNIPPHLEGHLRTLASIADRMRAQLANGAPGSTTIGVLPTQMN